MNTSHSPQLFHCLKYRDARRAIALLTAIGFREVALYADENDPSVVLHCELAWRDNGGVMIGSERSGAEELSHGRAHSAYLVVDTDEEVDAFYAAALAAGATGVLSPANPGYGGRGATIADAEGHHWSIGSYPGS